MHQSTVISFADVSFGYNGHKVVEKVSLEISAGNYVGMIGPNGSGKSTLLRLMLGLLKPTAGQIKLWGQPVHQFKDWTKIGYIPQKATQFESRFPITVTEVVSLGRIAKKGLLGKFNHADKAVIDHSLRLVGLFEMRKKLLSELSGGQQQRVLIAKALAGEPELLILDEPTVGVDMESQEKFYQLLTELNQKHGQTILIVSHDVDVIAKEVDTIACINRHLLYHGSPQKMIKEDYLEKLYGRGRQFITHHH